MRSQDMDFVTFLKTTLTDGPVAVSEIEARARAAGLLGERQRITNVKAFRKAKSALGIVSIRQGFGRDGAWAWALPPLAKLSAPEAEGQLLAEREVPAAPTQPKLATYGGSIVGADPGSPKESQAIDAAQGLPPEFRDVVGVPRSWLAGVARLNALRNPRDILRHRWGEFVTDCTRFVLSPDGWARRAADLGWDALALFGCSRRSPLMYLGCAGLLWVVGGGRIVRLHVDWAEIQPPANRSPRTYHRRRVDPAPTHDPAAK